MAEKHKKCIEFEKTNNKASEEHKKLANFIKQIHAELRSESEILGIDKAWQKHISKNEQLKVN
jgi:hypothetical protein